MGSAGPSSSCPRGVHRKKIGRSRHDSHPRPGTRHTVEVRAHSRSGHRRLATVALSLTVGLATFACSAAPDESPDRQGTSSPAAHSPATTPTTTTTVPAIAPPARWKPSWPGSTARTADGYQINSCVPARLRQDARVLRTSDGLHLDAVELGSGPDGVVLAHEQGYSICSWLSIGEDLAAKGYHVMVFEFRNHGSSQASPDNEHLGRDEQAAVNELRRRGATRMVLGGASCGGTASAIVGARSPGLVGLVILSSPSHCASMDGVAAVERITVPSYFAVSPGDMNGAVEKVVRELYDASASQQKRLVIDPSGYHGTDMLRRSPKRAQLRGQILDFVDRAFGR
jgi:dienelactone hydrolase